jgi:dihydrodipicolinate reductase
MNMLAILLGGASGKLGRAIDRLADDDRTLDIVGRASSSRFFDPGVAADVLIDFSRPELTARCLDFALDRSLPMVIDLVERAAAGLPETFDIEIAELHHRWKVDAPSGTALALGRAAADARGLEHERVAAVRGNGERKPGQIGYQASRGGDVAGEHTVLFLGDGERLELTHRATDRAIFARGALQAAHWLRGRPPGLYSMRDLLRA